MTNYTSEQLINRQWAKILLNTVKIIPPVARKYINDTLGVNHLQKDVYKVDLDTLLTALVRNLMLWRTNNFDPQNYPDDVDVEVCKSVHLRMYNSRVNALPNTLSYKIALTLISKIDEKLKSEMDTDDSVRYASISMKTPVDLRTRKELVNLLANIHHSYYIVGKNFEYCNLYINALAIFNTLRVYNLAIGPKSGVHMSIPDEVTKVVNAPNPFDLSKDTILVLDGIIVNN